MKKICVARNFGLDTTTSGFLSIINNETDIKNFKKGKIALFNLNFLLTDSLIIVSNLINKGAIGFISFDTTKSDHGRIAAKEMGMNFYSLSKKNKNILSFENKLITLRKNTIYTGNLTKKNNITKLNFKKKSISHKVKINLGFPDLLKKKKDVINICDGVGFSRIEFLMSSILNNIHPKKYIEIHGLKKFSHQISDLLRPAVKIFANKKKEYWIRTDDFSVEQLINMRFGKDYEINEKNSSTGLRGIRRSIQDEQFIIPLFKALKILVDEGYDNIGIFPPMTNSINEYKKWKKIAKKCGLGKIKYGLMVETPRAALMIKEFIKEIKFVVFGTNDLTSFLLSVDRSNPNVQHIFNENDSVVIKVLSDVIKTCNENSIETFIGGQIADNFEFVSKLSDSGLTGVSVNPDVNTVNKMINFYKILEEKNKNK